MSEDLGTGSEATDAALLAAVDRAAREVASERGLDAVLARLARLARELTDAPYAAIGLPDGSGGFERFVTDGMSDEVIAAIGWLPRTHGLLGSLLDDGEPYRIDDVTTDARFVRFPDAHPTLRAMLGVPIVRHDEVIGGFYVADTDRATLDARDLRAIELLAAHAAVAIDRARLDDLLAERSILDERARLAADLHDAMTQRLLGLRLSAATAVGLLPDDPRGAQLELNQVQELATSVMEELGMLVDQLRPPDLETEGLPAALAKHASVTARASGVPIALHADAPLDIADEVEEALLRIAQEALANALRHGRPSKVDIDLVTGERIVTLAVRDDGIGFDPQAAALKSGRVGLGSMRGRAERLGGSVKVTSRSGEGTAVVAELPRRPITTTPDDDG